jgi:hypothetical protein
MKNHVEGPVQLRQCFARRSDTHFYQIANSSALEVGAGHARVMGVRLERDQSSAFRKRFREPDGAVSAQASRSRGWFAHSALLPEDAAAFLAAPCTFMSGSPPAREPSSATAGSRSFREQAGDIFVHHTPLVSHGHQPNPGDRPMKTFILGVVALVALSGSAANAQDLNGTWQGTLQAGKELRIVFQISNAEGGGLRGVMYSIDQSGQGLAVSAITLQGTTVRNVSAWNRRVVRRKARRRGRHDHRHVHAG